MRTRKAEIWRMFLVAMVASVTALTAWGRLNPSDWDVPTAYSSDGLSVLMWIKAAQEGDYYPIVPIHASRLGAPFEANWNDYPMFEKTLTMLIGWLARWIGVFTAANFILLLAHVTTALSFYCCCRWMRFRWEWSFTGALLFAFTHYSMFRGLPHVLLSFSYTVPAALLTCWILASQNLLHHRRVRVFCWLIAGIMGISNAYNLILYLQLLGLTVALRWYLNRQTQILTQGAIMIAISLAAFFIVNAGTFIYRAEHGPNPAALDRQYFETEQFALKPLELVVPPPQHNLEPFATAGRHYAGLFKLTGESFSAYLGIVVIAGLIWMIAECFLRARQRVPRRNTSHLWYVGWIFVYSIVGGLNGVIALSGFTILRATNRFSNFISAVVLLFLVSRISRIGAHWSSSKSCLAAGLILAIGIVDQVPFKPARAALPEMRKNLEADRAFTKRIEQLLAAGSMIFNLPVMEFPESGPILDLKDYEPIRPYLHSDELRFSYGANKGRSRDNWQKVVGDMPPRDMIAELERLGFSGLLIYRAGFADRGGSLLRFLTEAGRGQAIKDRPDGDRILIRLHPAADPQLPRPADYVPLDFPIGWGRWDLSPERSRKWTSGSGTIEFIHTGKQPAQFSLSSGLMSTAPMRVALRQGTNDLWFENVLPNSPEQIKVQFNAPPGTNQLNLIITNAKSIPPADRGLALVNARLSRVE